MTRSARSRQHGTGSPATPADWWKTELITVGTHEGACGWETAYEGRDEDEARKAFTDIEWACATNTRGRTDIKLWRGDALLLHTRWHREHKH